jgi:hypothetical protein
LIIIIFPSMTLFSLWSLFFPHSDQNHVRMSDLSDACYMSIFLHPIILIKFNEKYEAWNPSLCSFLQPHISHMIIFSQSRIPIINVSIKIKKLPDIFEC